MKTAMMRRRLAVILICMLIAGLLPAVAFAADEKLMVNGTDITKAEDGKVICENGGTAVYDADSRTLTLNNASLEEQIYTTMREHLTIKLSGTNKINTTTQTQGTTRDGIYTLGSLTILPAEGTKGQLTISSNGNGIMCHGLDTDGVQLDLEYKGSEQYDQAIAISDAEGAPESCKFKSSEITTRNYPFGGIILSSADRYRSLEIDNSEITIGGDYGTLFADILKIQNSEIIVEDTKSDDPEDDMELLYGTAELFIENSKITAKGRGEYPALCTEEGGKITIHNSNILASNPDSNGIWSNGELIISGNSQVEAESKLQAVGSASGLTIKDNASVRAVSTKNIGIFSKGAIRFEGNPVIRAKAGGRLPAIASFHGEQEKNMLQCSPNLIPPGYKIGTTADGTKTSFIPVSSDFLEEDYSNGITESTGVFTQVPVFAANLNEKELTYTKGQSAAMLAVKAQVSDGGTLSYQWYSNSKNTVTGGIIIPGAVQESYTPSTNTVGTTYYYCIVTNTNSSAAVTGDKTVSTASKAAMITVKEAEAPAQKPEPDQGQGTQKPTNPNTGTTSAKPAEKIVKPGAPTKVKVSISYNKVRLSWSKGKGAQGYEIYRATRKTGAYKKVKTTKAASWTNTKLTTGKTYYYKVRSYNKQNGRTVYSAYSQVQKAVPRPSAPTLKVKASKGKITVKWSAVGGASKYQVYRATKKKGKYSRIKQTTKKSYTDRKIKKKKTYYYKARAYRVVKGKKIYGTFSKVKRVKGR